MSALYGIFRLIPISRSDCRTRFTSDSSRESYVYTHITLVFGLDAFGFGIAVATFAEFPSLPACSASRILAQSVSISFNGTNSNHLPPNSVCLGYSRSWAKACIQGADSISLGLASVGSSAKSLAIVIFLRGVGAARINHTVTHPTGRSGLLKF